MDIYNSRRNRTDLITTSENAKRCISSLVSEYLEQRDPNRGRKLDQNQQSICYRNFEILILDLLALSEGDPRKSIGYNRAKAHYVRNGSYWNHITDNSMISKTYFLEAIDFLSSIGLIENCNAVAGYSAYSSRIKPTKALILRFSEHGMNWSHLKIDLDAPAILLKDKNKNLISLPEDKGVFNYDEANTNIRRINKHLQDTLINLAVSDNTLSKIETSLSGSDDEFQQPLEFSNRSLKRIFSEGSLTCGGRFYGGWWQGLPSMYRKYIEIDGKMTVEMDYSTIAPRILYAQEKKIAPKDSYTLKNWDSSLLPEGDFRRIVKKAFNQILNSDASSKNTNQWHRFAPDYEPLIRPGNWLDLKPYQKDRIRREDFRKLGSGLITRIRRLRRVRLRRRIRLGICHSV